MRNDKWNSTWQSPAEALQSQATSHFGEVRMNVSIFDFFSHATGMAVGNAGLSGS